MNPAFLAANPALAGQLITGVASSAINSAAADNPEKPASRPPPNEEEEGVFEKAEKKKQKTGWFAMCTSPTTDEDEIVADELDVPNPGDQLYLRLLVWSANKLPSLDVPNIGDIFAGKGSNESDPYVEVHFQGKTYKTRHMEDNNNPVFQEVYEMPIGGGRDTVTFYVKDYDLVGEHDLLGTATLKIPHKPTSIKKEEMVLKGVPVPAGFQSWWQKPPDSRLTVFYQVVRSLENQPDMVWLAQSSEDAGGESTQSYDVHVKILSCHVYHEAWKKLPKRRTRSTFLRIECGDEKIYSDPLEETFYPGNTIDPITYENTLQEVQNPYKKFLPSDDKYDYKVEAKKYWDRVNKANQRATERRLKEEKAKKEEEQAHANPQEAAGALEAEPESPGRSFVHSLSRLGTARLSRAGSSKAPLGVDKKVEAAEFPVEEELCLPLVPLVDRKITLKDKTRTDFLTTKLEITFMTKMKLDRKMLEKDKEVEQQEKAVKNKVKAEQAAKKDAAAKSAAEKQIEAVEEKVKESEKDREKHTEEEGKITLELDDFWHDINESRADADERKLDRKEWTGECIKVPNGGTSITKKYYMIQPALINGAVARRAILYSTYSRFGEVDLVVEITPEKMAEEGFEDGEENEPGALDKLMDQIRKFQARQAARSFDKKLFRDTGEIPNNNQINKRRKAEMQKALTRAIKEGVYIWKAYNYPPKTALSGDRKPRPIPLYMFAYADFLPELDRQAILAPPPNQRCDPLVRLTVQAPGAAKPPPQTKTIHNRQREVEWEPLYFELPPGRRRYPVLVELLDDDSNWFATRSQLIGKKGFFDVLRLLDRPTWIHFYGGNVLGPRKDIDESMVLGAQRPPSYYHGSLCLYFSRSRNKGSMGTWPPLPSDPSIGRRRFLEVRLFRGLYLHDYAKKRVNVLVQVGGAELIPTDRKGKVLGSEPDASKQQRSMRDFGVRNHDLLCFPGYVNSKGVLRFYAWDVGREEKGFPQGLERDADMELEDPKYERNAWVQRRSKEIRVMEGIKWCYLYIQEDKGTEHPKLFARMDLQNAIKPERIVKNTSESDDEEEEAAAAAAQQEALPSTARAQSPEELMEEGKLCDWTIDEILEPRPKWVPVYWDTSVCQVPGNWRLESNVAGAICGWASLRQDPIEAARQEAARQGTMKAALVEGKQKKKMQRGSTTSIYVKETKVQPGRGAGGFKSKNDAKPAAPKPGSTLGGPQGPDQDRIDIDDNPYVPAPGTMSSTAEHRFGAPGTVVQCEQEFANPSDSKGKKAASGSAEGEAPPASPAAAPETAEGSRRRNVFHKDLYFWADVLQARKIPSEDPDGLCDPVWKLFVEDQEVTPPEVERDKVMRPDVPNSLNPSYLQRTCIKIRFYDPPVQGKRRSKLDERCLQPFDDLLAPPPPVMLHLYDWDPPTWNRSTADLEPVSKVLCFLEQRDKDGDILRAGVANMDQEEKVKAKKKLEEEERRDLLAGKSSDGTKMAELERKPLDEKLGVNALLRPIWYSLASNLSVSIEDIAKESEAAKWDALPRILLASGYSKRRPSRYRDPSLDREMDFLPSEKGTWEVAKIEKPSAATAAAALSVEMAAAVGGDSSRSAEEKQERLEKLARKTGEKWGFDSLQMKPFRFTIDLMGLRELAPAITVSGAYRLLVIGPWNSRKASKTGKSKQLALQVPTYQLPAANLGEDKDTKALSLLEANNVGVRIISPPFNSPLLDYMATIEEEEEITVRGSAAKTDELRLKKQKQSGGPAKAFHVILPDLVFHLVDDSIMGNFKGPCGSLSVSLSSFYGIMSSSPEKDKARQKTFLGDRDQLVKHAMDCMLTTSWSISPKTVPEREEQRARSEFDQKMKLLDLILKQYLTPDNSVQSLKPESQESIDKRIKKTQKEIEQKDEELTKLQGQEKERRSTLKKAAGSPSKKQSSIGRAPGSSSIRASASKLPPEAAGAAAGASVSLAPAEKTEAQKAEDALDEVMEKIATNRYERGILEARFEADKKKRKGLKRMESVDSEGFLADMLRDTNLVPCPAVAPEMDTLKVSMKIYAEKAGYLTYDNDTILGRCIFDLKLATIVPYEADPANVEEHHVQHFNPDDVFLEGDFENPQPFDPPVMMVEHPWFSGPMEDKERQKEIEDLQGRIERLASKQTNADGRLSTQRSLGGPSAMDEGLAERAEVRGRQIQSLKRRVEELQKEKEKLRKQEPLFQERFGTFIRKPGHEVDPDDPDSKLLARLRMYSKRRQDPIDSSRPNPFSDSWMRKVQRPDPVTQEIETVEVAPTYNYLEISMEKTGRVVWSTQLEDLFITGQLLLLVYLPHEQQIVKVGLPNMDLRFKNESTFYIYETKFFHFQDREHRIDIQKMKEDMKQTRQIMRKCSEQKKRELRSKNEETLRKLKDLEEHLGRNRTNRFVMGETEDVSFEDIRLMGYENPAPIREKEFILECRKRTGSIYCRPQVNETLSLCPRGINFSGSLAVGEQLTHIGKLRGNVGVELLTEKAAKAANEALAEQQEEEEEEDLQEPDSPERVKVKPAGGDAGTEVPLENVSAVVATPASKGPKKQKTRRASTTADKNKEGEKAEDPLMDVCTRIPLPKAPNQYHWQQTEIQVHMYVLTCRGLTDVEAIGASDPMCRVIVGQGQKPRRMIQGKRVFWDNLNPEFYEHFEFSVSVPGDGHVALRVYDQNTLQAPEPIGEAVFDIEERWLGLRNFEDAARRIVRENYSDAEYMLKLELLPGAPPQTFLPPRWTMPVEYLPLFKSSKEGERGVQTGACRVFLDLQEAHLPYTPLNVTEQAEVEDYEVRVIIKEVSDITHYMDIGERNDVTVQASFRWMDLLDEPFTQEQATDCHKFAHDYASFNWRMKFNVKLPCSLCELEFRLIDQDGLSGGDPIYLGERVPLDDLWRLVHEANRKGNDPLGTMEEVVYFDKPFVREYKLGGFNEWLRAFCNRRCGACAKSCRRRCCPCSCYERCCPCCCRPQRDEFDSDKRVFEDGLPEAACCCCVCTPSCQQNDCCKRTALRQGACCGRYCYWCCWPCCNWNKPKPTIISAKMAVSIEFLPKNVADATPAGLGRAEPNENPKLPEPEGRFSWSLVFKDPKQALRVFIGPTNYRRLAVCCRVTGCILAITVVLVVIALIIYLLIQFQVVFNFRLPGA